MVSSSAPACGPMRGLQRLLDRHRCVYSVLSLYSVDASVRSDVSAPPPLSNQPQPNFSGAHAGPRAARMLCLHPHLLLNDLHARR